jgi:hypothetical protein
MKHKNYLMMIALMLLICLAAISQSEEKNFGTKDWISNGLEGKIYLLPEETQQLPDFDTLRSIGTIYTKEIDVPTRSWEEGFPGVTDRFEWFGIDYKGTFKVKKAGHYTFQLNSDDGAKLFIDDSLVINNDGLHSTQSRAGEIDLDNSIHKIRLQYYQGPRTEIALQLFVQLEKEQEEVFPGKNFRLTTPGAASFFGVGNRSWMIILILILAVILFLIFRRRYRQLHFKTLHRFS